MIPLGQCDMVRRADPFERLSRKLGYGIVDHLASMFDHQDEVVIQKKD